MICTPDRPTRLVLCIQSFPLQIIAAILQFQYFGLFLRLIIKCKCWIKFRCNSAYSVLFGDFQTHLVPLLKRPIACTVYGGRYHQQLRHLIFQLPKKFFPTRKSHNALDSCALLTSNWSLPKSRVIQGLVPWRGNCNDCRPSPLI